MSLTYLISELRARDIRFAVEGERLIVDAPKGALRPDDIDRIRAWKPALLDMFARPAWSIIGVCRRFGVALRIDADGTLVVGRADRKAVEPTQPWPSLLRAIEAHLDDVAALVEAGWVLSADFPKGTTE